jgi:hypothetical protein
MILQCGHGSCFWGHRVSVFRALTRTCILTTILFLHWLRFGSFHERSVLHVGKMVGCKMCISTYVCTCADQMACNSGCMFACVYACMFVVQMVRSVYMYITMHTYINMYIGMVGVARCRHLMYGCMYTCPCTCKCVYTYIHTYIHVCMCVCVYIYIYTHIHTHTHTYKYNIHTYRYGRVRRDADTACRWHQCLHVSGNVSNIILYFGLKKAQLLL